MYSFSDSKSENSIPTPNVIDNVRHYHLKIPLCLDGHRKSAFCGIAGEKQCPSSRLLPSCFQKSRTVANCRLSLIKSKESVAVVDCRRLLPIVADCRKKASSSKMIDTILKTPARKNKPKNRSINLAKKFLKRINPKEFVMK
uniref:Uncharacterized protein n=1 Tax=Romanomermis culicivorax TaxID=13658 RepID=A0A915JH05_ROMCU